MLFKKLSLKLTKISRQIITPICEISRKTKKIKLSFIIALAALIISSVILILAFFPASQDFEGNLIVESLSFDLDNQNQTEKLFLYSISELKKIDIEGKQKFSLLGEFEFIDEELSKNIKSDTLEIELNSDKSKIIIEPLQPKESQLNLDYLRLQPETKVRNLNYNPTDYQLSLALKSAKTPNLLKLSLGEKPLKITLENYRLPQLKNTVKNLPDTLEFILTPSATEFNLNLPESNHLYINLPNPKTINTQDWILGNFTVEKVDFSRLIETEKSNDDLEASTILQGKIHLTDQTLNLEANQFLITVPEKPGIELIRQLQINTETPQGLAVRFRGKAAKIQAGIDPKFSVNSLQVNFLNKYLSRDAIAALLAFCAAVIGAVLPGLFTQD